MPLDHPPHRYSITLVVLALCVRRQSDAPEMQDTRRFSAATNWGAPGWRADLQQPIVASYSPHDDRHRPSPDAPAIREARPAGVALRGAAEELNTTISPGLEQALARVSAAVTEEAACQRLKRTRPGWAASGIIRSTDNPACRRSRWPVRIHAASHGPAL